jgi:hypothetical protein
MGQQYHVSDQMWLFFQCYNLSIHVAFHLLTLESHQINHFPTQDHPLNNNTTIELQDTNTTNTSNTANEADNPTFSIKDHHQNNSNTTIELQDISTSNATDEADSPTSPIHRRRNCPVRRNPDFLWM